MGRLHRALNKYGFTGTIIRIPRFLRSHIRKIILRPSSLTRFGVNRSRWEKFQIEHELDFWENNQKHDSLDGFASFKEKYFQRNKNKFQNIQLNFPGGMVVDVGCGPNGGFLPFIKAKYKVGIDPLAEKYCRRYTFDKDIIMISAMAENIPLISGSADACFCINTLDHVMRPYRVLDEIYRVLKSGGFFAFSVDTGGTKKHPIRIFEKDLNNFFAGEKFQIIEKRCATDASPWGKESGVPLYVFQGYKI